MKCLNPYHIVNPRYKGDNSFTERNTPDYFIDIPCGKCHLCLKKRAADWKARLIPEFNTCKSAHFITLTIDEEHIDECQENSSRPLRKFFEIYRKHYGKRPRHFFVTELGETYGRLHYHGIIFDPACSPEFYSTHWHYGFTWVGWCNPKTIGYIVKYIVKPQSDISPDWYIPKVFASPGLGKCYLENPAVIEYHLKSGSQLMQVGNYKYTLPRYLRERIFGKDTLHKFWVDQKERDFRNGFMRAVDGIVFRSFKSYNDYLNKDKLVFKQFDCLERTQKSKRSPKLQILPNYDFYETT